MKKKNFFLLCIFSAKGCFVTSFNEKLDELSLSMKKDCSDGDEEDSWSYSALNFGENNVVNMSLQLNIL